MKVEANADTSHTTTVAGSSCSLVSDSSYDTPLPKIVPSVQGRTTGPTRRSKKGGWTQSEDNLLAQAVKLYDGKNWKKIADYFEHRTDVQCLHRWQKVLNPNLVKGPWTKEEDDCIIEMVEKHGCKKWSIIAQSLPGRIGKQCRERWHNHLNPAIKKDAWTKEEEMTLIRAHHVYGNKWAEIAKFLPGRADNSIKNHWNCSVKKKLESYSGFVGDLPGLSAPVICSRETKPELLKSEVTRTLGRIINSGGSGGADTISGSSALGDPYGREEEKFNYARKTSELQCEGKIVTASRPMSQNHTGHGIHASVSYDLNHQISRNKSKCEAPVGDSTKLLRMDQSVNHNNLSLAWNPTGHVTPRACTSNIPLDKAVYGSSDFLTEVDPPVTIKRVLESPKRPRHYASPSTSVGAMDPRSKIDFTSRLSTVSTCETGRDDIQTSRQSIPHNEPPCSNGISLGSLNYEPPQRTSLGNGGENATLTSTDNYVQPARSPVCCSTPPSHVRNFFLDGSSPESVLRTAAMSFKSTPSIIRKRRRDTCRLDLNVSDSDGTPEMSSRSSDDVKWLSLSTSSTLKRDVTATVKSVRLEYAFDSVCDHPRAKYSASDAVSDSLDACLVETTGLMSLDNSKYSPRGGSDCHSQNFTLLDSGVDLTL